MLSDDAINTEFITSVVNLRPLPLPISQTMHHLTIDLISDKQDLSKSPGIYMYPVPDNIDIAIYHLYMKLRLAI